MADRVERAAWTVQEWLEATTLSDTTLRKLIREGRVEAVKLGRKTLVLTAPADFLRSLPFLGDSDTNGAHHDA